MDWSYYSEVFLNLQKGGPLMFAIFAVAVFMYFTAIDLYLRLRHHFLVRSKVHKLSKKGLEDRISTQNNQLSRVLCQSSCKVEEVRRHYKEVRQTYLPVVDRRIRFLTIVISTGPLLGLLGTVVGMLTTFRGMVSETGAKFDNMIVGISEALITTQTGLLVSIPALVMLSFIIQRRNLLERSIARLEYHDISLTQPSMP